jgi:hypothetical protein
MQLFYTNYMPTLAVNMWCTKTERYITIELVIIPNPAAPTNCLMDMGSNFLICSIN